MTSPDIEQLFRAHASQLHRIVRGGVRAPQAAIEDACQSAWTRLVDQRTRIRDESAFAWLATTAIREARLRAVQDGRRDSLEALMDEYGEPAGLPPDRAFEDGVAARERLRDLEALGVRQRRLMWLRGIGLSYREMAAHECCSRRTVDRQLDRARRQAAAL